MGSAVWTGREERCPSVRSEADFSSIDFGAPPFLPGITGPDDFVNCRIDTSPSGRRVIVLVELTFGDRASRQAVLIPGPYWTLVHVVIRLKNDTAPVSSSSNRAGVNLLHSDDRVFFFSQVTQKSPVERGGADIAWWSGVNNQGEVLAGQ